MVALAITPNKSKHIMNDLLEAAQTALRQWEYFSNEIRQMDDHPQLGDAKGQLEDEIFLECKRVINSALKN